MPINPYANQMQTMQTQGIPVQNFGGGGTPPQAQNPAVNPGGPQVPPSANPGNQNQYGNIANAIMGNKNFDRSGFQTARQDWRAQRPQIDPNMLGPEIRSAIQQWRAQRPQRQSFMQQQQPNPAAVSGPTTLPGV